MYYRLPACTNELKKTLVTAKMAVVHTSENHSGLSIYKQGTYFLVIP